MHYAQCPIPRKRGGERGFFQERGIPEKPKLMKGKNNEEKYGDASNISKIEKDVSFMNRYFILKKQRNVNTVR